MGQLPCDVAEGLAMYLLQSAGVWNPINRGEWAIRDDSKWLKNRHKIHVSTAIGVIVH